MPVLPQGRKGYGRGRGIKEVIGTYLKPTRSKFQCCNYVFLKHIYYYLSRPLQATPEVTPSRSRSYNGQQITILLPGAQHESGPFYGQIIKRNVHRHYKAIKHQLKSGKNSFRATGIAQT